MCELSWRRDAVVLPTVVVPWAEVARVTSPEVVAFEEDLRARLGDRAKPTAG